jgi:hypothetical protein
MMGTVTHFDFYQNRFTGSLPDSISSLSLLQELLFEQNHFTGGFPASFHQCRSLQTVLAMENHLTGELPSGMSSFASLVTFVVQSNGLSGPLSGKFSAEMESLMILDVSANQITGTLPEDLFSPPRLLSVSASSNCLQGAVPESICTNSPNLRQLVLDGMANNDNCMLEYRVLGMFTVHEPKARMSGTVPECLFNMSQLVVLHLSGNELTGQLHDLPENTNLRNISLSHNQLTGIVPHGFESPLLLELDLSYNKLRGHFHWNEEHDTDLSLDHNRLSGDLPKSWRNAKNIEVLNGNMFQCWSRDDLPKNDPYYLDFVCGSRLIDFAFTLGLVIIFISFVIFLRKSLNWARDSSNGTSRLQLIAEGARQSIAVAKQFIFLRYWSEADVPTYKYFFPRAVSYMESYRRARLGVLYVVVGVFFVYSPVYAYLGYGMEQHEDVHKEGGDGVNAMYKDRYVCNRIFISKLCFIVCFCCVGLDHIGFMDVRKHIRIRFDDSLDSYYCARCNQFQRRNIIEVARATNAVWQARSREKTDDDPSPIYTRGQSHRRAAKELRGSSEMGNSRSLLEHSRCNACKLGIYSRNDGKFVL